MCTQKVFGVCIFQELTYLSERTTFHENDGKFSNSCVYITALRYIRLDFKYKCATAKLCIQGKPVTYWSCSRSCVVEQNLHLNSAEVYTGRFLFPRICALSVIFKDLSHTKGDFFSCILYLIWFSRVCIFNIMDCLSWFSCQAPINT